jgi:hypothetical protein
LALPVFYGYQTERWEWVVSPRIDSALQFVYQGPDPSSPRKLVPATYVSVWAGGLSRSPHPWALGLEVRLPTVAPLTGVITFSAGKLWDFASDP